jgi:hypothetical protein
MRNPAFILALTGAAVLTGCSSLISLNPFVTDAQAISDPALVGTWKGTDDDGPDRVTIQQKGSIYTIHYSDGKSGTADFEGRLVRVGDAELMDIISTGDDAFSVNVHLVARFWPAAKTMQWAYLDSDWLRTQAKLSLATQPAGDRTLITTQGDAVVQFLKKFGADSRAYGTQTQWVRAQ